MNHQDPLTGNQLAQAWHDLRHHPALIWVPPMWRLDTEESAASSAAGRHAVSAVDRNLTIDICPCDHGVEVRLGTGPLIDRALGNGTVDPTTPAAVLDPRLTSSAPTFEQALVHLRDVVVRRYGTGSDRID